MKSPFKLTPDPSKLAFGNKISKDNELSIEQSINGPLSLTFEVIFSEDGVEIGSERRLM
jgi:hypothetical protein